MNKKNKIILFVFLLTGIIVFLKSDYWSQFIFKNSAEIVVNIGHHQINEGKSVYFRHKQIDSLHCTNKYKYFCFIPKSLNSIKELVPKQTLKIYNNKFEIDEVDEDCISLSYPIFKYLTENEETIIYKIDSVDLSSSKGYLYKITKMKL